MAIVSTTVSCQKTGSNNWLIDLTQIDNLLNTYYYLLGTYQTLKKSEKPLLLKQGVRGIRYNIIAALDQEPSNFLLVVKWLKKYYFRQKYQ